MGSAYLPLANQKRFPRENQCCQTGNFEAEADAPFVWPLNPLISQRSHTPSLPSVSTLRAGPHTPLPPPKCRRFPWWS